MSFPNTSFVFDLEIPPAGIRPIPHPGDFFLVVEANTTLEIQRSGAPFTPYEQGDSETMPEGAQFDRLEVKNPTSVPCYAKIFVGFGRRGQSRQTTIEAATRVVGATQSLAANGTIVVEPDLAAGDVRQKGVLISNGDGSNLRIQVRDAAGVPFSIILPGESGAFPVSCPIQIHNPNPSAVSVYWGRILWTL